MSLRPSLTPQQKRALKFRVYRLLNAGAEGDRWSRGFGFFLMAVITLNVISVIVETLPGLDASTYRALHWFDVASCALFSVEYVLRLWSCDRDPRFRHSVWGRIRFSLTPMALVDLLSIAPFYLHMLIVLDFRFARVLRLFRIFRLLKFARYATSLRMLGEVLKAHREELIVALSFSLALVVFAASMLYHVEHEAQPDAFSSIPAALWWGVCTLTTVGYGDIYPITPLGKLLGGTVSIFGVGLFALPAGILAAGFGENMRRRRQVRCPHCHTTL